LNNFWLLTIDLSRSTYHIAHSNKALNIGQKDMGRLSAGEGGCLSTFSAKIILLKKWRDMDRSLTI